MSVITWTTEQILGLAPDALMARAAERIANPQQWLSLGRTRDTVWGEFPNPNRRPFTVMATLPDLTLSCDCAGRKRPCRHELSLALMLAREPDTFTPHEAPEWTIARRQKQPAAIFPALSAAASSAEKQEAYERRVAAIQGGMRRLDRFLLDIAYRGLADLPARPITFWNEIATHLDNAHAPETAQDIRELGKLPGKGAGWATQLLRRLGRLYLLTQGFAAYNILPAETQADLRAAVGWFIDPSSSAGKMLSDRWIVLGSAHRLRGRQSLHRTWLYSLSHRRFAHLSRPLSPDHWRPALFSGSTLEASLRIEPGGWPQRASIVSLDAMSPRGEVVPGQSSLRKARTAYGKALSVNPWLRRFPLILSQVRVVFDGGLWVLRDGEGYSLLLPHPFLYGWHLQLLSHDNQSLLFGEWNGRFLTPLSIYHNNNWLTFNALRGQK